MILVSLALAIALQTPEKAGPAAADKPVAPAVDRSAESALKGLFVQSGNLKDIHISIGVSNLEVEADRYNDDSTTDIWIGQGGRVRVYSSSNYWGGGSLFVSDGLSLMTDSMSDDGTITLSRPKKSLHELNAEEPILFLLSGQPGFDALVEKDKPLRSAPSNGSDQVIELHAKNLGKILLTYRSGSCIPSEIGLFKRPWWMDEGPESAKPYVKQVVRVVKRGTLDSSLFKVAVPTGKKFVDERKKESAG